MKSILRTAAAGLAIASFGLASSASAATDATANVSAEILSTLQVAVLATDNTLAFGTIAPSGLVAASTVVVGTNDLATCGTNLVCAGTPNSPTFNIQGLTGARVAISLPASVTLDRGGVDLTGLVNSMTVASFTTDKAGNQFLLAAGLNPFKLGGTLTVSPLQAPGVYTGSVQVSVQYN